MSGRKKLLAVLVGVAALGVVVWGLLPSGAPDPICNGKRLSKWLEDFAPSGPIRVLAGGTVAMPSRGATAGWLGYDPNKSGASAAVGLAGTNAIPLLLEYMRARDSLLKLKLIRVAVRRHWVKAASLPPPTLG